MKLSGLLFTMTLGCLLVVVGCSSPNMNEKDLFGAEEALKVLQRDTTLPGTVYPIAVQGLANLSLGRSTRCIDAMNKAVTAPPEMYSIYSVLAAEACGYQCPKNLDRFAAMSPKQKIAELITECDAMTAEPLFTGELAAMRTDFNFIDYLVLRTQIDQLNAAASGNGSERAVAISKGFKAVAPKLAQAMKMRQTAYLKEMEE